MSEGLFSHFEDVPAPYASRGEQRTTLITGMWLFLASEAMLFSAIFATYSVYRFWYPDVFRQGSALLSKPLGTLNTAVLLTSSFVVARAVASRADSRKAARLIALAALLGAAFLGIKGYEWYDESGRGLFPGRGFSGDPSLQLFFIVYFVATGVHAVHLSGGILWALFALGAEFFRPHRSETSHAIETFGLYWHFVDLIWVFLYPSLYLVG